MFSCKIATPTDLVSSRASLPTPCQLAASTVFPACSPSASHRGRRRRCREAPVATTRRGRGSRGRHENGRNVGTGSARGCRSHKRDSLRAAAAFAAAAGGGADDVVPKGMGRGTDSGEAGKGSRQARGPRWWEDALAIAAISVPAFFSLALDPLLSSVDTGAGRPCLGHPRRVVTRIPSVTPGCLPLIPPSVPHAPHINNQHRAC